MKLLLISLSCFAILPSCGTNQISTPSAGSLNLPVDGTLLMKKINSPDTHMIKKSTDEIKVDLASRFISPAEDLGTFVTFPSEEEDRGSTKVTGKIRAEGAYVGTDALLTDEEVKGNLSTSFSSDFVSEHQVPGCDFTIFDGLPLRKLKDHPNKKEMDQCFKEAQYRNARRGYEMTITLENNGQTPAKLMKSQIIQYEGKEDGGYCKINVLDPNTIEVAKCLSGRRQTIIYPETNIIETQVTIFDYSGVVIVRQNSEYLIKSGTIAAKLFNWQGEMTYQDFKATYRFENHKGEVAEGKI